MGLPSQSNMPFGLKNISTSISRAKQVAMVKIGQSDSTVDPVFDQLEAQFKEQYKNIKNLGKYVQNYQTAAKELGTAQKGMAQMIADQYDSSDSMYHSASQLNENIIGQVEAARLRLDQNYNENFHQPLCRYLAQYKIIEERVQERNTRLVDMDRYNSDLKTLLSKPDVEPNRLQIAKEKAEYKSRDYNALNEELIRDIPVLLKDRSRFFDGLFANLVQGQAQYLVEAARAMNIIGPSREHVDRTRAASWPFSITEPSRSAFAGSTVLPDGPTFTSSHAPVQAPHKVVPQQQSQQQMPSGISLSKPQQSAPVAAAAPVAARAAAPPAQSAAQFAKALYPFQGQDNTEISFQPGDKVQIIAQSGDWWVGEINGARGYFPSNYVQML